MRKYKGVSVVFYTDGGEFVLQERGHFSKFGEEWSFFGGGVEAGESFEEAAKREIREELDHDLNTFTVHKDFINISPRKNKDEEFEQHSHIGVISSKVPNDFHNRPVNEGIGMKKFSYEDAIKLNMFPEAKYILDEMRLLIGNEKINNS